MGDFDFGDMGFGGPSTDISPYIPAQAPQMSTDFGAAPAGGGGSDWMGTLSGYAKEALPFLRLGTQGLGAYTGIKGVQQAGQQQQYLKDAENRAKQITGPAADASGQLITAGTQTMLGGPLPANLEAVAQNWISAAKARLRQFFAHSGITDSTMIAQAEAAIDAQAQELRAKLGAGLLSGGQGVGNLGVQGAQLEGNLASREGDTITGALSEANKALTSLLGMAG